MTYQVWLTNFNYPLWGTKPTLDEAIAYGKSVGFEFFVLEQTTNRNMGHFSPTSGWHSTLAA